MVTAINSQLTTPLSEKLLEGAFGLQWPIVEQLLQQAAQKASAGYGKFLYDVFLSTPMATFSTDAEYQSSRTQFKKIFDSLKHDCGLSVYWAGERIESMSDFDTLDISVLDDLIALQQSRRFALLYPQKLATSALFEAGYALALNRFSHYFVRDRDDLPFLMRELSGSNPNVRIHTAQDWKDYDDLSEKISRHRATATG